MSLHYQLVILVLGLTLDGRAHTGEIIGGHEAKAHSKPYMVLFERTTAEGKKWSCGGFLLSHDFVMTAAHCQGSDFINYTVKLGAHNLYKNEKETQIVNVEQLFPHKDYNADDFQNDIMLLKLSSKAKFGSHVHPIALAADPDSQPRSCVVAGWGLTAVNGTHISPVLKEINVTLIYNETTCVKKNSYCSEGRDGPYIVDSGGPLVCEDGKAYGVVSSFMNQPDGVSRLYTYAKIPDYSKWINSVMKKHRLGQI